MAIMTNFTQAVKELTGFDDDAGSQNNSVKAEMRQKDFGSGRKAEVQSDRVRVDMELGNIDDNNGSSITSTMVVNGQVESSDDIKILGKVNGDVRVTSNAVIEGKVIGNVKIQNLSVSGAVKGDITANGNIKIGEPAVIVGNIKSQNIVIDGKVKGNLDTAESTEVSASALIAGDIVTEYLDSERGSVISGKVTTKDTKKFIFDEQKLFDIGE